jgi:hypothetical protein
MLPFREEPLAGQATEDSSSSMGWRKGIAKRNRI